MRPSEVSGTDGGQLAARRSATDRSAVATSATERLRGQWLTGRPGADPVAVVRHLLAVQGQDLTGARLAVRARSRGLSAADVEAAFGRRELLITWLNRGTLHLVTPADYRWLHPLTAPRSRTSVQRRLRQEGVSPAQAERGIATVAEAIRRHGPSTRAALREALDGAGVPTAGQALVHLLFAAALEGLVVRGPMVGAEQGFVLVDDWLGPAPAPLDRAVALAELGRRYLAGHHPASAEDLAAWAGIPLGAARTAVAAGQEQAADDDSPAQLPPAPSPGGPAATPGGPAPSDPALPDPVLLGPFDPVLHGWPDREWVLGPHRHVITTNGIFKRTVLVGGRVVGTWTRPRGQVTLDLFEPVTPAALEALQADAMDVDRFLGNPDREPDQEQPAGR